MFFFGKPKSLLSSEDTQWQIETFRWLIGNFGPDFSAGVAGHAPRLVTPTNECFPDVCSSPLEVVEKTFGRVLDYSGMSGWPCKLQAQAADGDPLVGRGMLLQNIPQSPAGTFRVDAEEHAVVTFNPALVDDVPSLVATFAHELAHYKTARAASPPPGGWQNWEFATDLAAVYAGFGIFLLNTAFQFGQYVDHSSGMQGWRARRQGYLQQPELAQALATFVLLFDIDPAAPESHLKGAWRRQYRKALKYLRAQNIAADLRLTPPVDPSSVARLDGADDYDEFEWLRQRVRRLQIRRAPVRPPTSPVPSQNAPCHCGSGRKFKKCHGASGR